MTKTIVNKHMEYLLSLPDTDNCLLWPWYIRPDGYGQATLAGRNFLAHRVSLGIHTGECPLGLEAAHSCRNRACVNPRHLSWKTRLQNDNDKKRDGTSQKGDGNSCAKLTTEQVLVIREDPRTQRRIAADYGISQGLVSMIKNKERWAHI